MQTVPLDKIAPLMDDALAQLGTALEAVKAANARADIAEAKAAGLQKQLAEQDQVYLQKVASATAPFKFSEAAIRSTVTAMVAGGLCPGEYATKLATDLTNDPHTALQALVKIASFSDAHPPAGRGVTKSASDQTQSSNVDREEDDAAARMVAEGA